ncbi:MAG: hypothetical protein ABJU19_17890 [Roseobacter sp.]
MKRFETNTLISEMARRIRTVPRSELAHWARYMPALQHIALSGWNMRKLWMGAADRTKTQASFRQQCACNDICGSHLGVYSSGDFSRGIGLFCRMIVSQGRGANEVLVTS